MAGRLEGIKVLIIDDTSSHRLLHTRMVEGEGATVHAFENHNDVSTFPAADIILTDNDTKSHTMTGLEYIESLRAFNSADKHRNTPAILITSSTGTLAKAAAQAIPGLEKGSFDPDKLIAKILEVMEQSRSWTRKP